MTFTFSATEAGSTFQCRLDGPGSVVGAYLPCSSPRTYSGLADGVYTFLVRATDPAGNTDPTPATRAFTIVPPDPVWAPPPPVITSPTSYSRWNTSTITAVGTAQAGATVQVFDGQTVLCTTTATAAGTWSCPLVNLADRSYVLTAKASNLGGTSAASSTVVVTIDATPPNAPIITAPAAGSTVGTTFTISGTAEPGTTIELFQDGASRGTIAASAGSWSRQLTGVTPGARTYTARATDFAGNRSTFSIPLSVTVN